MQKDFKKLNKKRMKLSSFLDPGTLVRGWKMLCLGEDLWKLCKNDVEYNID
jgi:hypothetical protein